jgi:predicted acyl esterase
MRSGQSDFGEVDFGPDAAWGREIYGREQLRWFDRWLKGQPTGVEDEPPVRVFTMGGGSGRRTPAGHLDHGGRWRTAPDWPPVPTRETDFWLTADDGLARAAPTVSGEALRWTHDPEHPVPKIGAAVTGFLEWVKIPDGMDRTQVTASARTRSIVVDGPMHQRERPDLVAARAPYPLLAERPDVLVFQTGPLADDVEITGSAVAAPQSPRPPSTSTSPSSCSMCIHRWRRIRKVST